MNASLHIDSAGSGPPLVLLHGWALHSGVFGGLAPRLARHHRVHAVDLPGHGFSAGFSAPAQAFTIDAVADALDAAFAAEKSPLDVVGWSLGGQIALAWALRHPRRIARLVLVATTPRFVADDSWDHAMSGQTLQRFGDELAVAWKATVLRFLTLQMRGSDHGHAALAALRGELFARGEPSRRTLAAALAALSTADFRAEVGRISHPALVIAGNRDTLAPPEAGAWLAAALGNGRFVAIAGAAHVPFLSHPDAFGQALDRFLSESKTAPVWANPAASMEDVP